MGERSQEGHTPNNQLKKTSIRTYDNKVGDSTDIRTCNRTRETLWVPKKNSKEIREEFLEI